MLNFKDNFLHAFHAMPINLILNVFQLVLLAQLLSRLIMLMKNISVLLKIVIKINANNAFLQEMNVKNVRMGMY